MPDFIPGLELSRLFYVEAVRPLLERYFPGLLYAAGRIGSGSEVLGFDTFMSMDHNWFPNVQIFLHERDSNLRGSIWETLSQHLSHEFRGFPLDTIPVPGEPGIFWMQSGGAGPVQHRIYPTTLHEFVLERMAWDICQPLKIADWLTISSQILREMTSGVVHYDGVGELTLLRQQLSWYPHDIWLYLMAAGWQRIAEEEHLMPRAGDVGDELGSALIGSRLVRDVMSLCFLMEKQYAPYPKWFGSAFKQLTCANLLEPWLQTIQQAASWQEREAGLTQAYQLLARLHNQLGITSSMPEFVSGFHSRPFQVIHAERFSRALVEQITDPEVNRIAQHSLIGSIDLFSDNTRLRSDMFWRPGLRRMFTDLTLNEQDSES
jgi:hypothetical protein